MMTYTIYVCPEDHWLDGGTPVESWWRGQGRVCSMCNRPVDEVEVVRVDEHPVLAVIERARAEGLAIELLVHPDDGVMCSGITLREANIGWRLIKEVMNAPLDKCARELLANWPEKA